MKCTMCENDQELKFHSKTHKYKESGLENVILHGVLEAHCPKCGEIYLNFGNLEELHKIIAMQLIKKATLLIGKEIRFLRKYLGYSGSVFSKLVGYEVAHLSRIENGKSPVQEVFDRLIRVLVLEKMPERKYKLQDLFLQNKFQKLEWLEFILTGKDWKVKGRENLKTELGKLKSLFKQA